MLPGTAAHICNRNTLGGQGRQIARPNPIPSLLKIQKLAGYGGTHLLSQLLEKLRQEYGLSLGGQGCSEPRSCHCIPAWMGFHHDGQAGLELLTSCDPPTSASQSARITGMSHRVRPPQKCRNRERSKMAE
ncbi:hypothetical protein AAY473_038199 [Plecturocebus cupreus]